MSITEWGKQNIVRNIIFSKFTVTSQTHATQMNQTLIMLAILLYDLCDYFAESKNKDIRLFSLYYPYFVILCAIQNNYDTK